ncbi:hypothetical protein PM10SUCC1_08260 [Propionigenium maris DSM 9537]|uniref:Periplasmic heavy metal sensor n=1 Tax=Propionigenium maris DSM 9537 TaxID=1123000 RepID=A0A9W6GJL2_9FUSO|nr:periplasmic heavy metal sensor [Propionigenium maris]GLI55312.1 hypothetical protein PM10SUCC1_08260 [Propionigenium maris DSM 9537]
MKKIVAILAVVVVSAGAFAQTMDHSAHRNMDRSGQMNHGGMMQQMNNLTPEEQAEFNALHAEQMRVKQKSMLDIKEINLKIQREMTADIPNQKNIDKLIDQRAKLKAQHQKDMLNFRLDMKEKFGIQMGGGKKCGMMG